MANVDRSHYLTEADEALAQSDSSDYFIRLLVERHAIRAAISDSGASIVLTGVAARTDESRHYSGVIGNDIHLDLLEAEGIVQTLTPAHQRALMEWVDGMTSAESAMYSTVKPRAIRTRRKVAIAKASEAWNTRSVEVPVA